MRIGILGAASIAPDSLIKPARLVEGVEVAAIAARDKERAERFARRYGIPLAYSGYDQLLADATIDAVYVPLPNGLHGRWAERALAAGKHVLVEKPFTANAAEAEQVSAASAAHPGLVVMEAFHYRYHPLTLRALEVLGELGAIESVDIRLCVPMPPSRRNVRWSYRLAGGSMMDLGSYAAHMARTFGGEPTVIAAQARMVGDRPEQDGRSRENTTAEGRNPYANIDRWLHADLVFPRCAERSEGQDGTSTTSGASGEITVAMWSSSLLSLRLDVHGSAGSMSVTRLISPQFFGRLHLHTPSRSWTETSTRRPSYAFQLEAFRNAVAGAPTNLTPPPDSVATMRVIDAAYAAAGLPLRQPS